MRLGERIKTLRLENKLTLEEVAIRIGTTRQTIQRYETGEITNIPSDKIEKLAMVYNTSPIKIMGWDTETKNNNDLFVNDERKDIINKIAKLSETDFKYVAELVKRLAK